MRIGNITLEYPVVYLIAVNLLSLISGLINIRLRRKKGKASLDPFVIFLTAAGGAAGTVLSFLAADRKAEKENMMVRVASLCFLVIDVIAVLVWKQQITDEHRFSFWKLFIRYRYLLWYICGINLITFIVFGVDKLKAKKEKERIKITTLLLLSAAGGSVGGGLAMLIFRHKTKKSYFSAGIPLIIITQLAVIIYLLNCPWLPALYS